MPTYKFECSGCGERHQEYMTFEEHDARTMHTVAGRVILRDQRAAVHWVPSRRKNGRIITTRGCGVWEQVFNFNFGRPMPAHYSPFLDAHVTSRKHYDDLSKIQQEEMSARMGYDVSYDEIDPTDARAAGVKGDAGFESQEEARFYDGDALDAEDAALFDS